MIGSHIVLKKGAKGEAEKPFWISFADMMTSLMVLFLVVMSVALLAVTREIDESERQRMKDEDEIRRLLEDVKQAAAKYPGMQVDIERRTIDFGPHAHFEFREYSISTEKALRIRAFVRNDLLPITRKPEAQNWLKLVVVEGYTDTKGSYLYNLDLSLNRSHNVLCALLEQRKSERNLLTKEEQEEVRNLFLVGGYSFNSAKETPEKSRRVELRLEFLDLDKKGQRPVVPQKARLGRCRLS